MNSNIQQLPFPTKLCKHCGKTKDVSEFNKASKAKDGLQAWCRECSNSNRYAIRVQPGQKIRRGDRRAAFENWLLTGLVQGYITNEEAKRLL